MADRGVDDQGGAPGEGATPPAAVDPSAPEPTLTDAERLLALVADGVAGLRELPLYKLPEWDLLRIVREVEAGARSVAGVQVRLAGELVERGTAQVLSVRSPARLLHESLNVTMAQARDRVAVAGVGLPRGLPSGGEVPAELPGVLSGIDAGVFGVEQGGIVARTVAGLPGGLGAGVRERCTALLLEQARVRDAVGLRQVAEQIRLIVDPDGVAPDDAPDRAELRLGHRRDDGLTPVRGLLDDASVEVLRQAVEPLAAPKPVDERTPDRRPAANRRAWALGEVCRRYLAVGSGPRDGGVRPRVVITLSLEDLMAAVGPAWADYTGVVSAQVARLLACDAELIPQVLGTDSVVLDQGRSVRLFPPEIRRAITTRDRGCAFPGCDVPAAWCQAHHISWWDRDCGPTSAANGVLLCSYHHHVVHQGHWTCRQTPSGRPEFVPPPHIDPDRRPRRNTHWHPPDLLDTG